MELLPPSRVDVVQAHRRRGGQTCPVPVRGCGRANATCGGGRRIDPAGERRDRSDTVTGTAADLSRASGACELSAVVVALRRLGGEPVEMDRGRSESLRADLCRAAELEWSERTA